MNEGSHPAAAEAGFVSAQTAATQIEEAMRRTGLKGLTNLKAEIWNESAGDWTIGVSFECSKYRFLWWGYGPLIKAGFQVTGNARHSGENGLVVTNSDGSGDKGAVYTIWTILHCEYLWVGEAFADCIKRIKALG